MTDATTTHPTPPASEAVAPLRGNIGASSLNYGGEGRGDSPLPPVLLEIRDAWRHQVGDVIEGRTL